MKIKKIILGISKDDLLKISKIQNKVELKSVEINEDVKINGECSIKGVSIPVEVHFDVHNTLENRIYLNITTFKIIKVSIPGALKKIALSYVINAFTDIKGISQERKHLVINVNEFIGGLKPSSLDMKNLNVEKIAILKGEIEVALSEFSIDLDEDEVETIEDVEIIEPI